MKIRSTTRPPRRPVFRTKKFLCRIKIMHKLSGPKAILNGVEVISATLNSIKWALLKQREDWLQRESCNFKLTTASMASSSPEPILWHLCHRFLNKNPTSIKAYKAAHSFSSWNLDPVVWSSRVVTNQPMRTDRLMGRPGTDTNRDELHPTVNYATFCAEYPTMLEANSMQSRYLLR